MIEFDDCIAENYDQEDAMLLNLARERMKNFDPAKLVPQADVNLEFGFTEDLFRAECENSADQLTEHLD